MSVEEISVLKGKKTENSFVSIQEHVPSYYKINKEVESSARYILPIQFKLPYCKLSVFTQKYSP